MNRGRLPESRTAFEALEVAVFIAVLLSLAIGLLAILTGNVDRGARCLCFTFGVALTFMVLE